MDLKAAEDAVELITGGWRAQCLYTAVKLGVPDLVAAGRNTDAALAEATGTQEVAIHRLMRLLVAMEVFTDDADGYHNTPTSTVLTDSPGSLRNMCLLHGEEFYTAWAHAEESIITLTSGFEIAFGEPLGRYLSRHEEASERFQLAAKADNLFFDHVPDVIDLRGKTVVDVVAGSGRLTAAILAAVPDARVKVGLTGGDMTKSVPTGGDVYFLCHVLASRSDDAVVEVFENCRAAMPDESSRLVILERVVADEKPTVLPALWDLHLLMTNGGEHRTLETYTELLVRAGLRVERVAELPSATTAIIAAPQELRDVRSTAGDVVTVIRIAKREQGRSS